MENIFGTFFWLGVATGDHLSVKPTKIAAGVESEKTNELLQALARAINKKVKRKSKLDLSWI